MTPLTVIAGTAPHAGATLVARLLARHGTIHVLPPATTRTLAVGAERILHGATDVAVTGAGAAVDGLAARLGTELVGWLRTQTEVPDDARPVALLESPTDLRPLVRLAAAHHGGGGCDLVVVVREPRSNVAAQTAAGTSVEHAIRAWLLGARAILGVTGRPLPPGVRVHVVRHEDLTADPQATVEELGRWLGLERPHGDPAAPDTPSQVRGAAPDLAPTVATRVALRTRTEARAFGYDTPDLAAAQVAPALVFETVHAARRLAGRLLS